MRRPIFVGHNLVNFDLPFIYRRAVILGIQPPAFLPINPSPFNEYVFDTMLQWAGSKGRISMQNLCEALGIPGKETDGDIDGSKVTDFYQRSDRRRGEVLPRRHPPDASHVRPADVREAQRRRAGRSAASGSVARGVRRRAAAHGSHRPGHLLEDLALPGAEAISPWSTC